MKPLARRDLAEPMGESVGGGVTRRADKGVMVATRGGW